jgi:transcriptional regulator with XRE-family HTH domain
MSLPLKKLKKVREQVNQLTIVELAGKAQVSTGVISKAENGGRVSLAVIKKLEKALNVGPGALV